MQRRALQRPLLLPDQQWSWAAFCFQPTSAPCAPMFPSTLTAVVSNLASRSMDTSVQLIVCCRALCPSSLIQGSEQHPVLTACPLCSPAESFKGKQFQRALRFFVAGLLWPWGSRRSCVCLTFPLPCSTCAVLVLMQMEGARSRQTEDRQV